LKVVIFAWNDSNRSHLDEHGVSTAEAEFVVSRATSPRSCGSGKLLVVGPNRAGQPIQVVFVLRSASEFSPDELDVDALVDQSDAMVVYVIHAMHLTPTQQRRRRRKRP
jgi:uncharacterized DUF497 family protein